MSSPHARDLWDWANRMAPEAKFKKLNLKTCRYSLDVDTLFFHRLLNERREDLPMFLGIWRKLDELIGRVLKL